MLGPAEARSFLLNDVTASEREHFEEQVLLDDAFFEDLAAVEDELIEEFARGELEGHEAQWMGRRVESVQEWPSRIAFSRALAEVADGTQRATSISSPLLASSRRGGDLAAAGLTSAEDSAPIPAPVAFGPAAFGGSAWLRWGSIAATVALALIATWFGSLARTQQLQVGILEAANARLETESLRLESQLREGQTQLSSLESALQERAAELEKARVASEELQQQLRVAESTPIVPETAPQEAAPRRAARSLTFVLGLSGLRSETKVPSRVVSEGIEEVKLQLDLEGDTDYPAFRVRITNPRGEEIWSQDGLLLVERGWGGVVELTLPSSLLPPGRYEIAASGHRHQGGLRDVGFYALEIAAP